MPLLRNGIDLSEGLKEFVSNSDNLFIFVPYIKLESLKQLLATTNNCKAIIVRWEPKDLILGSSDLDVYQYCKEKNITLYRNSRLHLKAFVNNYESCIMGSPNISARALNLPEMSNFNYELATTVENLSIDDRLYFNVILNDSTLITDAVYKQLQNQLAERKKDFPKESDFEFKIEAPDKDFLISSLPMSKNVETFFRICQTKEASNNEELNCAMHDLALYGLSFSADQNIFAEKLRDAFFNHPFIKAFLKNIEDTGEIYFGTANAWIHSHCSNVPLPRRWEIKENISILYSWIAELSDGKYLVDVPGAYSQRLRLV